MTRYVRKTTRRSWEKLTMAKAIDEVVNNDMSLRSAAVLYDIPRSTLTRRVRTYGVNSMLILRVKKAGLSYVLFFN